MKPISLVFSAAVLLLFCTCNKSTNTPASLNCDNLITDTAGTNDNGKILAFTAFTPNADGLNDVYKVFTSNIASMVVTVYDENNSIVFTSNHADQLGGDWWSPSVSGNTYVKYYYRIQATTNSDHKIGMCGELYLVNCVPANTNRALFNFEDQLTVNGFTNPTQQTLVTCN